MDRKVALSTMSRLLCLLFASALLQVANVRADGNSNLEALIPSSLAVPEGNDFQQLVFGVGYQVYQYNGSVWVNTNVSADFYNFKGLKVGHHLYLGEADQNGGQSTWETFHPSSRVTGKPVATVPQADTIDWVLLQATSNSGSSKLLGHTTFVQRLYTQHGLPPSVDSPAHIGDLFESNFTSMYAFFTTKK